MLGKKYFEENNYEKALENFLLARIPEEEAGGSKSGNRSIQVNYFIGLAYEAMGNKTKSKNYYTLSARHDLNGSSYNSYYQALSLLKLGEKTKALEIFDTLIADGERQINRSSAGEMDFFTKFGEREAENARLSNAYLIKGLGYKGLGDTKMASDNLKKALELSASNLYASVELQQY
jgi:tetratricopeptide (TPR) repeat protein